MVIFRELDNAVVEHLPWRWLPLAQQIPEEERILCPKTCSKIGKIRKLGYGHVLVRRIYLYIRWN